jgi:predicted small secreted protein
MKKLALIIFGIAFISISFTSCKSSKKGCGLTSDAQKIEQTTTVQNKVVSEVK